MFPNIVLPLCWVMKCLAHELSLKLAMKVVLFGVIVKSVRLSFSGSVMMAQRASAASAILGWEVRFLIVTWTLSLVFVTIGP